MDISKSNLFIIDVETTGTSPLYGGVIEIGVLRVERGRVVRKLDTLVNPGQRIPAFIEQLTGITSDELDGAPEFGDIAPEVRELAEGAIFVAHNAAFDYGFIRTEFRRLGLAFSAPKLCTVRLSRHLYPEHARHDLSSVISRHGLACDRRHRAFDDAKVLWDFIRQAQQAHGKAKVDAAAAAVMKLGPRPSQLSEEAVAGLHEGPGVYIFRDRSGSPLYVGKSIHVKERVLSHFQGAYESGRKREMLESIADIECLPCAGELEALLLESETIKRLKPTYNILLRERRVLLWLEEATDARGYLTPVLRESRMDQIDMHSLLGIFKTRQAAEETIRDLSAQHMLCNKIMGVEKIKRNCFNFELGRCAGACIGKEAPAAYNARFALAFKTRKVRKWAHPGPLLVKESAPDGSGVGFVVDNWCLTKKLRFDGECVEEERLEPGFDLETYKILARALGRKFKHLDIVPYEEAAEPAIG